MARLVIAEGFLAEYAQQDKDVQGTLDAAIVRFAMHVQQLLYLEKPPHSRDDRIWIIRGDDRRCGVVPAPATDDTYRIVTVLPQDKVLEARDEEAIQQPQPSLQATAEPDDKRLFADVADAELTRLGDGAQILPTARLPTKEANLERRQTVLPESRYAAHLALACGMTTNEVAWFLFAAIPREQVDLDEAVFAVERLPGRSR